MAVQAQHPSNVLLLDRYALGQAHILMPIPLLASFVKVDILMDGFGDLWPWNRRRREPERKEMEFPGTAPGLLDQSLVYFANANGVSVNSEREPDEAGKGSHGHLGGVAVAVAVAAAAGSPRQPLRPGTPARFGSASTSHSYGPRRASKPPPSLHPQRPPPRLGRPKSVPEPETIRSASLFVFFRFLVSPLRPSGRRIRCPNQPTQGRNRTVPPHPGNPPTPLFFLLVLDDKKEKKKKRVKKVGIVLLLWKGEQLRRTLAEKHQKHYRVLLCAAEESAARRLREKELEVQRAQRRSTELEDRLACLRTESMAWQAKAMADQATALSLHAQLQHAASAAAAAAPPMMGGGRNETPPAEEAGSAYVDPDRVEPERSCRACRRRAASVVLLPCRHLCLCDACDAATAAESCPVCRGVRTGCIQVCFS
ncbi:hypothetical protein GW17_00047003 [Ensete ventricosum]|nr:hypothetical protein GW17_00047003 [Ensete ventricosum]